MLLLASHHIYYTYNSKANDTCWNDFSFLIGRLSEEIKGLDPNKADLVELVYISHITCIEVALIFVLDKSRMQLS